MTVTPRERTDLQRSGRRLPEAAIQQLHGSGLVNADAATRTPRRLPGHHFTTTGCCGSEEPGMPVRTYCRGRRRKTAVLGPVVGKSRRHRESGESAHQREPAPSGRHNYAPVLTRFLRWSSRMARSASATGPARRAAHAPPARPRGSPRVPPHAGVCSESPARLRQRPGPADPGRHSRSPGWPAVSVAGAACSAISSVPGMSGMIASLTTASKRSGCARNTLSASRRPDAADRLVAERASTSSARCTRLSSSSTTRMVSPCAAGRRGAAPHLRRLALGQRQVDAEGRAGAAAAVDLERRVVVQHDAVHQRQAQSRALPHRLGGEERVKDALDLGGASCRRRCR